jgi:dihydroflavonol-4-reductase
MPAYVDTGLNLVHVDDVANGHLLALDRGMIGERYILGGDDLMLGDMLDEITHRRAPSALYQPAALAALSLAWANEWRVRLLGGAEPFLTLDRCACRATACSFPRPRRSATSAMSRVRTAAALPTRSRGSARRG